MEAGWKVGDYAVTGDQDTLWQATAQTSGTTIWETIGGQRWWATGELEAKFGPLRKAWIQRERRPGDCPRCGWERPLHERYGVCQPCVKEEVWGDDRPGMHVDDCRCLVSDGAVLNVDDRCDTP